jgi:hypothetical protein
MKRLAILFAILCFPTFALAQKADAAFVVGGSFVNDSKVTFLSTPTIVNTVKTNNHVFYEGAVAVRLADAKLVSLHLELPVVGIHSSNQQIAITAPVGNTTITVDTSAIFITPALRLKVVPGAPISPWVSLGGGWARFATNGGPTTNKGAIEYGGGLDFKTGFPLLGFRAEARDFVTGDPNFGFTNIVNGDNGGLRRHNLMVGGGIVLRF